MAENDPCAGTPTGKTPTELFDDAHFRVYQMFHLCTFVADLAGQIGARQVDEQHGESIQLVFSLIADQLHAANEELLASARKGGA
jgi:hypothetical protein